MSLFTRPLSLSLYGLAARAATPLAPALLRARARRGKEDETRLAERLGRASAARPAGPLVWLHGVSVGESLSLLPLIERLRHERADIALLVTTGTPTSAELLTRRAPPGIIHQYAPVDTPSAVARFLDHWRPDVGLFAESELWPTLILSARRRGVRLALVSARITEKTARGWSHDRGAARTLLGAFDRILTQDQASAERIRALGGRVDGALNLKLAAPPLGADDNELERLQSAIGGRPVILGASTHDPEEIALAEAVGRMSATPVPLLVLAPRHPDRGGEIAAALRAAGRSVVRRSLGETIGAETGVYLADSLGEMGLLYRLADVAVIGGSFFGGVGGHNPLEPARLGAPVIAGTDLANFAEPYAALFASGAALKVESASQLTAALDGLVADPERRRAMSEAALAYAQQAAGDLERGWSLIAPLLPAAAA
ncbi:MAG TPA: glycosyltransferase N-terminal domain-containing protein [Caulobacteraceae bacterium]|nr:glycosyltransferase N-terminal domain-containing protein [Caulobacteraceae bacterium]